MTADVDVAPVLSDALYHQNRGSNSKWIGYNLGDRRVNGTYVRVKKARTTPGIPEQNQARACEHLRLMRRMWAL